MEKSNLYTNKKYFQPSFEFVYSTIMRLKNKFLKQILFELLGDGTDESTKESAGFFAYHFLIKQRKEAELFRSKLKKGEVTKEDLNKFNYNRYNSIYCLVCLEEIKSEFFKCNICQTIFHEHCYKRGANHDGKCIVCERE